MRFSLKRLFLLAVFACNIGTVMAQAVAKEVFGSAVDHINCETIRFIHREAGRAEVANNMDCLSFESIYKSIPADETGTTGALCKNINDYKNKFKQDKPLDAQLNAVIAFADAKIGAKKRKGNVEDFKASLEKIKKDALDEAKGGNATAANTTGADAKPSAEAKKDDKTTTASDTSQAITEPAAGTAKAGHKTDWLGLLSLLVALGGLGLAYMAYTKAKKLEGGSMHPVSTTYGNKSTKDDAMQEIMRVEKHFKGEIANLNKLIDDMMKSGTIASSQAPSAAPAPVKPETTSSYIHVPQQMEPEIEKRGPETEINPQAEPEMKLVEKTEDVVHVPEPELIPKPEEPIAVTEMEGKPESQDQRRQTAHIPEEEVKENEVKAHAGRALFESAPAPAPSADLFAAPAPKYEEAKTYNSVADAVVAGEYVPEPVTRSAEPFMPEKEYEDGEAVPFYKFAGLPNEDGYFENNSFTDEPGKDSVYEIEMYEDVPDKAFFSIRSNPDVIRRAILDPQVYLAPCCTYTDDHEGKHTIVLVEEGMLRKENDRWIVYEKAKINFE